MSRLAFSITLEDWAQLDDYMQTVDELTVEIPAAIVVRMAGIPIGLRIARNRAASNSTTPMIRTISGLISSA